VVNRVPASIVVTTHDPALLRGLLDALRPTLSPLDEVVAVVPADVPGAPRWPSFVRVVARPGDDGAARVAGAAVASKPAVVFLDPDVVPTARWLEELLAPLIDETVGAVGPVADGASGAQHVVRPSDGADRAGTVQRFARAWSATHRGRTFSVDRLDPVCVAVRRAGLDAIGGPGAVGDLTDLCELTRSLGRSLVVAAGSYLAGSPAAARRPEGAALVSAALVVNDEEALLPQCLASLAGFADEVVVYDTGSSDRTVDIARAAGAIVIEGYWDDDFARARNAALEHCTGRWIVHLDADEELTGDRFGLRGLLASGAVPDGVHLMIDNLDDSGGVGSRHQACRVFRRLRGRWVGALHEQVHARDGQTALATAVLGTATIRHHGYRSDLLAGRNKTERNLRVAEAQLHEADDTNRQQVLLNLARTLYGAGRLDECLERASQARSLPERGAVRVGVLRIGTEALLALGRPREALDWAGELRRLGETTLADFFEGSAWLQLGDGRRAAQLLEGTGEIWDASGQHVAVEIVATRTALALAAGGRDGEAASALLAVVTERPQEGVWGALVVSTWRAGLPLAPVVAAVPDDGSRPILAQIALSDPCAADAFGEALWNAAPATPRSVAFAVHVGPRLASLRALEWAARVRGAGLPDHCPLVARSGRVDVPASERVVAAAVAHQAFADQRAAEMLERATRALPDEEITDVALVLNELAPRLLSAFVLAAATTPARGALLADLLEGYGATDEANAIRAFAGRMSPVG